ncbi:hypothetical protein GCM10027449_26630 [Sinomonas notoginsengisoli]|uniref:hypothetical protein n=1 Tax=Sinomonas notoginsengisoli TaxID=1457311 RepID=UPI001F243687|nr:hypothetical protein [Sinomonas notoginsengisoli]
MKNAAAPTRHLRIWTLAVIAAVVQATVAAVIFAVIVPAVQNGQQHLPSGPDNTASPPSHAADAAVQVAAALEGFPSDPIGGAAESMKEVARAQTAQVAPPGTRIEAVPATWEETGPADGTMAIRVTYPGSAPKAYLAFVTLEEAKWKLVYTLEADSSAG